jgi:probable rRNA maturation factor
MTLQLSVLLPKKKEKIPTRKKFRDWLQQTLQHLTKTHPDQSVELSIRIVDKEESARLNEHYRHKKGPTNVLSFTYPNIPGEKKIFGDLAICAEIVIAEANEQHKTLEAHWAHLTIHGILHVFGFDHEDKVDARIMETLEIKILRELGYSNPYSNQQE